jgi:NTE family protein
MLRIFHDESVSACRKRESPPRSRDEVNKGRTLEARMTIPSLRPQATSSAAARSHYWIALCACAIVGVPHLHAAEVTAEEESTVQRRPRIGLVLGGGGARGAAHVGVLKVIEELRIPVDYVAGTSMGSIVGGLYASGLNAEQIEREILAMNWNDLFQDYPSREVRSFRRKRDDQIYLIKAKPGYNKGKVQLPLAYIRGQKFDLVLNRLTLPMFEVKDFDLMPIPYRAVATDIETGKEVVLSTGSLAKSIRASMAVPAAFDPVEIDGRLLIDGGLANNVPVSVVRDMGAEVFIVVDVGSGLYDRDEINSALDITGQLANFLFTLNTEPQLQTLGSRDVLIRPQLGDIGGNSFDRASEAIPIGERAARESIEALRQYSLSTGDYARHVADRTQPGADIPVVEFVRTNNDSKVADEVIASRISASIGQPLDVAQLESDIGRVYGLDIFESVRYDILREDEKTGLLISATEKHWGPAFVQFGLDASSDMDGGSTFKLGLLYSRGAVNALNGEWRTGVQIGDEPAVVTEVHQPLDPLSRYFLSGSIGYSGRRVDTFDDAGDNIARYQLSLYQLELGAGREFGTWGEGRLGYRRASGDAEVKIGTPAPDIDLDRGEIFLRLSDDKMDSFNFPRAGHYGKAEWIVARKGLGARSDYDQVRLNYSQAFSWGSNTLIGGLVGATTLNEEAPLEGLFQIGGLFRLSGLQENQLSGQHAGLVGLIYMRRLQHSRFLQSYIGGSLEAGNVWQDTADVSLDNSIIGGSAFLGLDTPIGPVYLGYGRTDTSESSIYIHIGPRLSF